MTDFIVVGVGGFVARRHLEAIRECGGRIVAAVDTIDNVGILDSFAPDARFYRSVNDALAAEQAPADGRRFVSICTPSFLHYEHTTLALNAGWEVICEKPLVTSISQLDALRRRTDSHLIWPVLQLRSHPDLERLQRIVASSPNANVRLTYVTPRGEWYHQTWKGRESTSGGLLLNIGIHLFDMLCWLFGTPHELEVDQLSATTASGSMLLERATVEWMLSLKASDHPQYRVGTYTPAHRVIDVNGEKISFSEIGDLHGRVYRRILSGTSTTFEEASIALGLVLTTISTESLDRTK